MPLCVVLVPGLISTGGYFVTDGNGRVVHLGQVGHIHGHTIASSVLLSRHEAVRMRDVAHTRRTVILVPSKLSDQGE